MTMNRRIYFEGEVRPEWIDEFGHMGYLDYQRVADIATMAFWDEMNGGSAQSERDGGEFAIIDVHARYMREVRLGDPLSVATRLVGCDAKRFTLLHEINSKGELCATVGLFCLSFHLGDRRVRPFDPGVAARMAAALDPNAASDPAVSVCLAASLPARR
ncbi:acyl-CoA thioesterase [Hypericibacter sp.]|uniref:acyl-CoA thioesterase n=1 Tax=Hypericibacter sp. TaxID=2705401 RepID=UPI003D6D551F